MVHIKKIFKKTIIIIISNTRFSHVSIILPLVKTSLFKSKWVIELRVIVLLIIMVTIFIIANTY